MDVEGPNGQQKTRKETKRELNVQNPSILSGQRDEEWC